LEFSKQLWKEPDALPPSTHRVVLTWDDEKGPVEHVGQSATGIPCFNVARTIARSKRFSPIDELWASAASVQHYVDEICQQQFANDQDREKWLADYSVHRWYRESSDNVSRKALQLLWAYSKQTGRKVLEIEVEV
jgi:hypothetical protein